MAFAKQFETYAAIDRSVDFDRHRRGRSRQLLQQLDSRRPARLGHAGPLDRFYQRPQLRPGPGSESDSTLLLDTVSDPASPYDWAVRATGYTEPARSIPRRAASNVELFTTEFNSVYSNPGKQTTSLVNGLFIADSLGELLETSYDGAIVWDLRNG